MNFTSETKVKDIALSNSAARQVLESAGLDYCCGGGSSLHDACMSANVQPEELLKRLGQAIPGAASGDPNLANAPLGDITELIRVKHHQYVRTAISRVRPLAAKVIAKHGANHPELAIIGELFDAVSREMIQHMQKEEQILFPYIEAMERAVKANDRVEPPFFQTVRNPIQMMMNEHDAAGEIVRQIRRASGEYAPPADACTSFQALYEDLKEFEADLHTHVHIENNILFPRAIELEATAG